MNKTFNPQILLQLMFLVTVVATGGSLYFSEVLKLPPCVLCWYQRICMYPLALILGTALWSDDTRFARYSFPFSVIGLAISLYHCLLYYEILSESIIPCQQGVSCTTKQIAVFGFMSIPLMSLTAFLILSALHILFYKAGVKNEK
ncbi:MAG: disulfide bond formation protein B [Bdellovibrionaceae bacterium]|nr:disulfide bond formation protein B [Pseudobdellovibrionaceae bacterium]